MQRLIFCGMMCGAGCFATKPGAVIDAAGQDDAVLLDSPDAQSGDEPATSPDDRPGDVVLADVPDATDAGRDVTNPSVPNCTSCNSDDDCGAHASCLPVGATRHCLWACTTDGDCPRSFICYASSTASKSCLPISYDCVACVVDSPCDGGKTCDFTSGVCKDPRTSCDHCTYDFDCADGQRCYKKTGSATGACVPECSTTTPCADTVNYTCGVTDKGVQLCVPIHLEACGGCTAPTPFPAPDGKSCYGCLNNSHCTVLGETCDVVGDHTCKRVEPVCGSRMECPPGSGNCQECCEDADCPDDTGPCDNNVCVNQCWSCSCECAKTPTPICEIINNVPQCVQCSVTSDCAGIDPACVCTGDPTYTCQRPDGSACVQQTCAPTCMVDADCPPGPGGETILTCSTQGGGYCVMASGGCDGTTACCNTGQTCFDLKAALAPSTGSSPGAGEYCTCDDLHPCLGSAPCTRMDDLCSIPPYSDTLCPVGVKPSFLPDRLCVDLLAFLGGLSGGGGLP